MDPLTNPRQLLSARHVENPTGANRALDRHQRRGVFHHPANQDRLRADFLIGVIAMRTHTAVISRAPRANP